MAESGGARLAVILPRVAGEDNRGHRCRQWIDGAWVTSLAQSSA
jgi:hypothetical protein